MIHELLHRWHINADTQQYKTYTSSIIMTSLFRTKTKTIPILHPLRQFRPPSPPFQDPSPRVKVRTEEEKSETAGEPLIFVG